MKLTCQLGICTIGNVEYLGNGQPVWQQSLAKTGPKARLTCKCVCVWAACEIFYFRRLRTIGSR
jgi:hypothetical protein